MKTPQEKYNNDPKYRMLVDTMENLIHQAEFTPSEVREAAMFACIQYESRQPVRPIMLRPDRFGSIQRDPSFCYYVPDGVETARLREGGEHDD